LTIAGLNQYYGESHTLWDLSLDIPAGQCTCVMGRNGVGKTTLMDCIMGLLPLRSGTMELQGHDLVRMTAEKRAGLGIGYVPQGRQIFPLLTVEENLDVSRQDMNSKIIITLFSLFAELERDLISLRTREALAAKKAQGRPLGKPKGTLQKSKFDQDVARIKELLGYGLSVRKIAKVLGYSSHIALNTYINKRGLREAVKV